MPIEKEKDLGDLSPGDGLSDHFVDIDGLDNIGGGAAEVRFKMFTERDGVRRTLAILPFAVPPKNDGMEGMIVRGYDDLIAALRQMLYEAATARQRYKVDADLFAEAKARKAAS